MWFDPSGTRSFLILMTLFGYDVDSEAPLPFKKAYYKSCWLPEH